VAEYGFLAAGDPQAIRKDLGRAGVAEITRRRVPGT
jgi:hypothetical protein